ncbi:MAG: acetylglutamate kinase [Chloroflexota bacterium]|nr:acetylglutamate kinase [Chloroflexota bacterium]
MQKPIVVKIGGSTLGNQDTALEDLVLLQRKGIAAIVIHGGGQQISSWLSQLGISTKFVNGLRITDEKSLKVTAAVLGGLVNKELVAAIQALGGKTIGISGVDGNLLQATIKSRKLGYVGEITKVNPAPLSLLLKNGYLPVIAPICFGLVNKKATLLNLNADVAAGEIAAAIAADKLIFLTDVDGVRDDSGQTISRLTAAGAKDLLAAGKASGGMIPKIEACLKALSVIAEARIIDGSVPHALLKEIKNGNGGTTIASE